MLRRTLLLTKKPLATFARSFSNMSKQNELQPFSKLAEGYSHVGLLRANGQQRASCVLVHQNIALTASHCIFQDWWDKKEELETVFSTRHSAKVKKVLAHPGFERNIFGGINNDIAVLILEKKVETKPARLHSKEIVYANDCTVVGFPGSFPVAPAQFVSTMGIKLGFKASCYTQLFSHTYYPNVLESRVGLDINTQTGDFKKNFQLLHQPSTQAGMSGGGVFKGNKLIGLVQGSRSTQDFVVTHDYFVSVQSHMKWLEKIFQEYASPQSHPIISKNETETLEALCKIKIDPNCKIFISENEIKMILPNIERVRCTALLLENGFAPHYQPPHQLFMHHTFILIGETFSSAFEKLTNMPNVKTEESYQRSPDRILNY